jgi:hypothetical protein
MTDDRADRTGGDTPDDVPAFVDDPGTVDQAGEPAADGDDVLADAPDTSTGKSQELFDEDQPGPGV